MEEKLAEYRARKRKGEMTSVKNPMLKFELPSHHEKTYEAQEKEPISPSSVCSSDTDSLLKDNEDLITTEDPSISCPTMSMLTLATRVLYIVLWATVLLIAMHYQFALVYTIISAICLIYMNTRTGPKKIGEVSAYSVFNPNCKPIHGTLTAEQLEREMGFRVATTQ
uniref:SAYSvFN domain-containing protein n=1 Tax=Timema poppense TaxID=170557 RepID=A0A7R9CJI1_TIMPO|nr:unnamed protein product [Timema poppensis]